MIGANELVLVVLEVAGVVVALAATVAGVIVAGTNEEMKMFLVVCNHVKGFCGS